MLSESIDGKLKNSSTKRKVFNWHYQIKENALGGWVEGAGRPEKYLKWEFISKDLLTRDDVLLWQEAAGNGEAVVNGRDKVLVQVSQYNYLKSL